MTFDSVILAAITAELRATLMGGRIDKIHQPSLLDIVFGIRNNSANYNLLVSSEAQSPRIHLVSTKRPNPKTPPNFCMLLRKHLEGARLSDVAQVDFDRIVHIIFTAHDGESLTLAVEIMGKHSNIVLINGIGRILGAVKPIGRRKNRYREILPGREYIPPPPQEKTNPLTISEQEFREILLKDMDTSGIAKWLGRTFTGISPFLAKELSFRADGDPTHLSEEFLKFFADVKSQRFSPVLITDNSGRTTGFYPFPIRGVSPSNQHSRSSINTAADVFFTSCIPRDSFEHALEGFLKDLRREFEARENTLKSVGEGLAESKNAEQYKRIGELLLSQSTAVPAGSDSAELIDYYQPDCPKISIELDSRLTIPENAERYFKKYRKAQTSAESLKDRLSEAKTEIRLLQKILDSAESITSEEKIEELLGILRASGILFHKQEKPAAKKKKPEFDGHRISKATSEGREILFGENSEANDYLTTRVARSTDIWLHVKAATSAHVVIRTNGKPDAVPRSALYAAAEIAVKHSNQKHSSLVPVDYTLIKNVRRPKGAPSGKVIYHSEKTLYITTE